MGYSSERGGSMLEEPFAPRLSPKEIAQQAEHLQAVMAAASSEAAGRDAALMRDLNHGAALSLKRQHMQLRQPRLPSDHAQRVADLAHKIYERGVAFDKAKLLSLGKMRFARLLKADREARSERVIGTRCDLSSFDSVYFAFAQAGALQLLPVPAPTTLEEYAGTATAAEEAREIEGFGDLWKFNASEPRAIRAVYVFRALFEALIFGQSVFSWLEDDGRVHHPFFARGSGDKARLFAPWLPALQGAHYRINVTNALPALVFWLAGEYTPPPEPHDLAQEFFGVRVPSPEQITFAGAVLDGWLLNYKDWQLWQHVGRATRNIPDKTLLERHAEELRERFRKVAVWHRQLAASFLRPVTDHSEFQPARHREFLDATLAQLRDCVSALAALTVEENSPPDATPVVARFQDSVLCSGKPKSQLAERIVAKLQGAFAGANFKLETE
jgi:hypothetical protein